ncbi:MAG TPA: RNA-binding S4 domain-containing protein [bacterium]|nr:RNA-binding S4 domain-containing protein [bacterium]
MEISTPRITLGEFLKWVGVAPTGGRAKVLVQSGRVFVNGSAERRRGRRLGSGDLITVEGREYRVVAR